MTVLNAQSVRVQRTDRAITIHGLPEAAQPVIVGTALWTDPIGIKRETFAAEMTVSGDGWTYAPPDGVSPRGRYVLVDRRGGRAIVVDGAASELTVRSIPASRIRTVGDDDEVELDGLDLVIVTVAPGRGVWSHAVSDAGPEDRDGSHNGRVIARVRGGRPVGAGDDPPGRINKGSFIIAINRSTLEVVRCDAQ